MTRAEPTHIRVQREDFDPAAEAGALTRGRADVGALVTFVGLCRDEGGALAALEIEHYPGMAEEEIARVVADAQARWPLVGVRAIHRYGEIRPGEQIVMVATASTHRGAAFAAAEFLMDYMKTRAPFWKRARRADGRVEGWVDAKDADDASAARWDSAQ
jgi:molybdopterin synthase catalytic subunit